MQSVQIKPENPSRLPSKYRRRRLFWQILAATIVSWQSILTGYSTAFTSPADLSMTKDLNATQNEKTWISALLPIGAFIGSITGGPTVELMGRKLILVATNGIFSVSFCMGFFAWQSWHMYISRVLAGYSVGIVTFTLPVYLAETVQPKIRGRLSLFPSAFGNFGILLVFVLGVWVEWHSLAGIGFIMTLPFYLMIWFIPDTPRWYINHKKYDKSRAALQWLRGTKCDVQKEYTELLDRRTHDEKGFKLILQKPYRKPIYIVIALMFFQQFTGINAVIFYTTEIFEQSGTTLNAFFCTTIIGLTNFLSVFLAAACVDHCGRKMLLYVSGALMTCTLAVLGVYFFVLYDHGAAWNWLPLTSLVVYVLAFSLGYGPIPFLLMGEVLAAPIRGHASSVCTAFSWIFTFIVIKTFPFLIDLIGNYGTYWLFGLITLASLVFVIMWVPETKRKTLEEIEKLLH